MYGCSPTAEPGYMNAETAERLCERVRELGCGGLHIGGGEPFLEVDKFVEVVRMINKSRVSIDYIETNAAWITRDAGRNAEILNRVVNAGGGCVMVSADLFHVEFIPFWKVKTLIGMLREKNVPHFIWQERFLRVLSKLEENRTYNAEELSEALGYDAVSRCASEYGMGFNGRALKLHRAAGGAKYLSADETAAAKPCANLTNANHFHVDYLGNYIPPGCTGVGIKAEDLGGRLGEKNYPAVTRLFESGTKGLLDYARGKGFAESDEGYVSRCDLCFQIRKFLIKTEPENHPDLAPAKYYEQDF